MAKRKKRHTYLNTVTVRIRRKGGAGNGWGKQPAKRKICQTTFSRALISDVAAHAQNDYAISGYQTSA